MLRKSVEVYSVNEFFNKKEITKIDKCIGIIKTNKQLYLSLALCIAIILLKTKNIYAYNYETSLNIVCGRILDMLIMFARWSCLGMGLKEMIVALLNGSNLKTASAKGIQYLMAYIFIKLYPSLFDMFNDITF